MSVANIILSPILVVITAFIVSGCTGLVLEDSKARWHSRIVETDIGNRSGRRLEQNQLKIKLKQISLLQPILDEKVIFIPSLDYGEQYHVEENYSSISNDMNNFLFDVYKVNLSIDNQQCCFYLDSVNNLPVFNTNLPIVVVNSLNNQIFDEPAISAKMDIVKNKQVFALSINNQAMAAPTPLLVIQPQNYITDKPNVYSGHIKIEIRGKSSQNFCKKQYKVETQFENGSNRNVSLLGMPTENDWILHAPYSDKTLIRNKLAYSLWEQMGWYAPRSEFVELLISRKALGEVTEQCLDKTNSYSMYLSNHDVQDIYEYNGIYLLIEKIKRDVNRVNITKLESSDNSGSAITGGYLLKIDKLDNDDIENVDYFISSQNTRINYVDPGPSDITSVQRTWIKNHINEFESVLSSFDFSDPINGYRKYIDINSFVDFFLIQEFFKNIDGFRISTYFYKDRNEKIKMGPAWDFNLSSGNADYCNGASVQGWYTGCGSSSFPMWWSRLLSDPWFRQKLLTRWNDLRSDVLSEGNLMIMINSNTEYIKHAARRNFSRWDILGKDIWPNSVFPDTYGEEINNLKTWLTGRLAWIDTNLSSIDQDWLQ